MTPAHELVIYLDVPAQESELVPLPEDRELLSAMVRTLLAERNREKQRAEEQAQHAEELRVELLRLQLELERFKKWYYGPRAIVFSPATNYHSCC